MTQKIYLFIFALLPLMGFSTTKIIVRQDTVIPTNINGNENDTTYSFYVLEQKPEFKGGIGGLMKWIAEHTNYPKEAKKKGITGKVFVQFVIERDGSVSNVKLARKVNPLLDEEAVRVIKMMPKWKPGKQRGKPVRVMYQIPINFVLDKQVPKK
jgi:TonB family protein